MMVWAPIRSRSAKTPKRSNSENVKADAKWWGAIPKERLPLVRLWSRLLLVRYAKRSTPVVDLAVDNNCERVCMMASDLDDTRGVTIEWK
jgi:hypothetical protein